jgi:hypothetical protein
MSHHRESRLNLFARVWSKAFTTGRRRAVSSTRPRVWPQLEYLEDRVMPATTINVNTTADIPLNQLPAGVVTLRDAIQIANTNGDASNTINLTVAGVYNISLAGTPGQIDNKAGEFAIFTNATANQSGLNLIIQNTSGGKAIINGNGLARVFDINPNNIIPANNVILGTVTINDVTIENGTVTDAANPDGPNASGGGIRDQGPVSLALNRDILSNNAATADGGGVSMENAVSTNWKLTLNNTTVVNNHAGDAGGGIEEDGTGQVVINSSTIADNTCLNQGAGVWLDAIGNGTSVLNVTKSVISGNTAGQLGGGIGQAGSSTVTISNSTLAHNFTTGFGGGFADENNLGTLVVQNSLFLSNSAGTNGGGVATGGPSTTITNSEFKGNAAGINGNMPIGSTGHGKPNAVMGSGGGLFISAGTLSLTASTIADNTATINGGGLELQGNGNATLTNVTIAGNTALNSAPATVGNHGGGIDMTNFTGNLLLVNDTITNNFAFIGGGLYWAGNTGSVTSQNSLIALNTAATGPDVFDVQAGVRNFTDQGNNFIGINTQSNGFINNVNGSQVGNTANPLNPMVTGLSNNGGPVAGAAGNAMTLETEALLPGSLAIGKGKPLGAPAVDERNAPRIGAVDIGAFQFENVTLQLTIKVQPASLPLNGQATVTVEVLNTSGNPLPADASTLTLTTTNGLKISPQTPPTVLIGPVGSGQTQTFTFKVTGVTAGAQTITATVTSPDTNPTTTSTNTAIHVVQGFGSPPPSSPPPSSSPPSSPPPSSSPSLSPVQMALEVALDTAALFLQGNALALQQLNNQSEALLGQSLPSSDHLLSSILSDLSMSEIPGLLGLELGLSIANSVNGTTT